MLAICFLPCSQTPYSNQSQFSPQFSPINDCSSFSFLLFEMRLLQMPRSMSGILLGVILGTLTLGLRLIRSMIWYFSWISVLLSRPLELPNPITTLSLIISYKAQLIIVCALCTLNRRKRMIDSSTCSSPFSYQRQLPVLLRKARRCCPVRLQTILSKYSSFCYSSFNCFCFLSLLLYCAALRPYLYFASSTASANIFLTYFLSFIGESCNFSQFGWVFDRISLGSLSLLVVLSKS